MSSGTDESTPTRDVHIIATAEVEKHTVYTIQVTVDDCKWTVQHRYSEFHELHEKLVALGKVEKSLLPPKRLLGNLSKSFVEKRRSELEIYLQTALRTNNKLPRPLLLFLEFDIYDVNGVSQALASELFDKGDLILASQDVCEMTPMQVFAISERLKLPLPTCDSDDAHSDIGHIMDFMSRLKYLRIVGSTARLGSSTRKVDELPFDLSQFKSLKHLQIDICNAKLIAGIEEVKRHITYLAVHRTLSSLQDLLLPNLTQWEDLAGSSGQELMTIVPPWNDVKLADFSRNELHSIDISVRLLPSVTQLDLSHNALRSIDHLQHLSLMTHLNLSYNQVTSLEGLHTRLGNVHSLLLTHNDLSSLKGLGRLYSLVMLDARSNLIEHVTEIQHVCNLPCLENLLLNENPVTNVEGYRTKVLELFEERFTELTLDGHKATEKEKDTVNILKAIKRSKDYRPFVGSKQSTGKKVVNEAAIMDPSSTKASESQSIASNATGDDAEFRAKVESLRKQGGNAWLSIFNEMSDPSEGGTSVATATKEDGHKIKNSRSPKKEKTKRARSRSPQAKTSTAPAEQSPPIQPVQLSPKAFAYHVFDEVSRHGQVGITSLHRIFTELTVYLQGPQLYAYGPRHRVAGMPTPAIRGPTLETFLREMNAGDREEFIWILRGVRDGSVQLAKTFPSEQDAERVLQHVLDLLGLKDETQGEDVEKKTEEVGQVGSDAPKPPNLEIDYSTNSEIDSQDDVRDDTKIEAETKSTISPSTTHGESNEHALASQLADTHISSSPCDNQRSTTESSIENKTLTAADETGKIVDYSQSIPSLVFPPRAPSPCTYTVPDYEECVLEHLSSCKPRKVLDLTPPMQCLATMTANELVKYFHENTAQIGKDLEYLGHVTWTNVITYANPTKEVLSCVMLSSRALYILSDGNLQFHQETWKTHRRMCSDSSAVNRTKLNSGTPNRKSHASGLIHSSTDYAENRVRCQHVIPLAGVEEVVVGLFDQKIRLTGGSPDNTATLITRSFKETHSFQQQLMQCLPHPESPQTPEHRPSSPMDLFKEAMKARQEAVITEYKHPSGVKFIYANEETINDLTYLVVEKLSVVQGSKDSHLLMYMLLHQIGDVVSNNDYVPLSIDTAPRNPRSLILTNTHAALCREDHVCYPIPDFSKLLPDSPQYCITDVQPIHNLKRLVVSDFSSRDITLVFEVIEVEVDISREYFASSDLQGSEGQHTPDVVWTLMLPSLEDRERLMKMLCGQWRDMHNKELSIQVSA